jgi:hypothetical protein
MDFARVDRIDGDVIQFVAKEEAPPEDLTTASWLLPVILDEESPAVGFPAALFILSRVDDPDSIESLARFLDALLSEPVPIEDGKVSCTGMIFEARYYDELRRMLEQVVDDRLCGLFRAVKINAVIALSDSFRVRLPGFCRKHQSIDEEFTVVKLLDILAPLKTGKVVTERELRVLERATRDGEWKAWTVSLLLLTAQRGEAAIFLETHPDLDQDLRRSQWQHLKEL